MRKSCENPLETSSLSAIEHLLEHRPDQIRSLRLSDRSSPRLATLEAAARSHGIRPSREKGLGEGENAVALLAPYAFYDLKTVIAQTAEKKRALLVALDHVQDPQNFGAICRTAEGLGIAGIVFPKHRSVSVTGAVYAASAGAVATLPLCQVANLNESLRALKEAGFWVVGSSVAEGTTSLDEMPDFDKMVLVLGSENSGLSALTESLCDWKLRIPIRGRVQSLNVSAAGAILMHELSRRVSKEPLPVV